MAKAQGFKAQTEAIGQAGTLAVNVATVLAEKKMQIVPQILVTGGGGGGSLEALAATLTKMFGDQAGVIPLPEKDEGAPMQ